MCLKSHHSCANDQKSFHFFLLGTRRDKSLRVNAHAIKKRYMRLTQGRVMVPLNVPFWKAPTLVTLPTVIVPPAVELAELPNSGITGK